MSLDIYKKLNEVHSKVKFVKKDGKLGFGNNQFSIVTHDAVLTAVREHLVDAGILIIPAQVEKGTSVEGQTKSGTAKIRFEALYDVDFIAVSDGSKVTIRTEAHAEDSSDKAANKAITYAVKNAMLKALMLETGDEDAQGAKNTINLKQVQLIQKLVVSTDTDLKDFLAFYGVDTLADMPEASFTHGMKALQAKEKKQKESK